MGDDGGNAYVRVDRPLRLLRPVPVYILAVECRGRVPVNITTVSWVVPVSKRPPMVGVVLDMGSYSLRCLDQGTLYSLNTTTTLMAELAKYAGTHTGWEEDKASKTGTRICWAEPDGGGRVPVLCVSPGFLVLRVEDKISLGSTVLVKSRILDARLRSDALRRDGGVDLNVYDPLLHWYKHYFVGVNGRVLRVTRTRWGPAVKKPWRDRRLDEEP